MISLDNNAAGRARRRPAVTRKYARRSRNKDAARLAAGYGPPPPRLEMAGLNVLAYFTAYLGTYGHDGGEPPSGPDLETLPALERRPRRPAHLGTATPPR